MVSKVYPHDIDLLGNELQNATIQNLVVNPESPKTARVWFNTTDDTLYVKTASGGIKDALAQGKTYTNGTGINIVGTVISIDGTVAQKSDLPTVNNATLTIQKNGTTVTSFTANSATPTTANITVPTTAADVNALPDSTKYGAILDMALNTTDYKLTLALKDQDGNQLSSKTVDFPIESVVVNGSYDSTNKKIILTLQSGATIEVPVGDLIAGLQAEITSTNKLASDLVDDSTSAHKFVTASEKTQIATNTSNITSLQTDVSTLQSSVSTIQTTMAGYGDIVTHNISEFMHKFSVTSPELTPVSGECTWTVTNTLETNEVFLSLYWAATGEIYDAYCAVGNTITVKVNSDTVIPAGAMKLIVFG